MLNKVLKWDEMFDGAISIIATINLTRVVKCIKEKQFIYWSS